MQLEQLPFELENLILDYKQCFERCEYMTNQVLPELLEVTKKRNISYICYKDYGGICECLTNHTESIDYFCRRTGNTVRFDIFNWSCL